MTGRPRSHSDEELIDATVRVIGRTGVGRLTLEAVAKEAGIATSSLHERFGSRRALLLAVVERMRPPAPREDLPPRGAILELLVRAAAPLRDRDSHVGHASFLELDLTDPEFGAHARRWALEMRATIERLLEAAGYEDASRRAPSVHAAQQGALTLWMLDGEGTAEERIEAAVTATL